MKQTRKKYAKEFKVKAVELGNLRGNVPEVARELDISADLIYRWRRELKGNAGLAFGGNGKNQLTSEEKEIERLKKELADVRMERDILKKAVRIFSVSDGKSTGS